MCWNTMENDANSTNSNPSFNNFFLIVENYVFEILCMGTLIRIEV